MEELRRYISQTKTGKECCRQPHKDIKPCYNAQQKGLYMNYIHSNHKSICYTWYFYFKKKTQKNLCVCVHVRVSEAQRLTDSSAESPPAADRSSFTPDRPICTQSDTDTQSPSQSAHSPFVMSDHLSETTSQVIEVIASK